MQKLKVHIGISEEALGHGHVIYTRYTTPDMKQIECIHNSYLDFRLRLDILNSVYDIETVNDGAGCGRSLTDDELLGLNTRR